MSDYPTKKVVCYAEGERYTKIVCATLDKIYLSTSKGATVFYDSGEMEGDAHLFKAGKRDEFILDMQKRGLM